jgi:preprotein translocase subunit YajC
MTNLFVLLMSGGAAGASGGGSSMLIMMPLILIVMYFFMIRPQQKKAKDAQKFKETVEKGSKIVTIGGIHGRILEVRETTFVIEVGNGAKLEVEKSAISMEMTKAVQAPPKPIAAAPATEK